MTTLVDTELLSDIKLFGAADVSACFSCGTCTAICPLVDNDSTFPRRIIRYAQVGMRDELLSSKELWTCYPYANKPDRLLEAIVKCYRRIHGVSALLNSARLK